MRFLIGCLTILLAGTLIAQVSTYENVASSREIMTSMVVPASNALFTADEKPTEAEWAGLRMAALVLAEAGNLLMTPGRMAKGHTKGPVKGDSKGSANPAAWNQAASAMRNAGKLALAAVDKRDMDLLTGDVAEQMLASCSSCHNKYMDK
jgi:cytochrome c556